MYHLSCKLCYFSVDSSYLTIMKIILCRDLLPGTHDSEPTGYDVVIMSDLLHFHSSHDVLVNSVTSLLSKSRTSRVYVAAGKYTAHHVCDDFLRAAGEAGVILEEGREDRSDRMKWLGTMDVSGLNEEDLTVRKGMCRWWVGRWRDI
jgi:EEF1A N-terminal glycine/lysine methyltransferase